MELHEPGEQRFVSRQLYNMLDIMGVEITCDICGRWQHIPLLIASDPRREASNLGWKQRGQQDVCRICAGSSDR